MSRSQHSKGWVCVVEQLKYCTCTSRFTTTTSVHVLSLFIHPIHRFKLSDWLKGHMAWIIFGNVHGWTLIHVFYFLFTRLSRSCHSCRIWNQIAFFPDFTVQYGLKNLRMGCIKQILTALLFREWQKIVVPLVKFNLGKLFTSARGSRSGWISPRRQ